MPLADFNDPAVWEYNYHGCPTNTGVRLHGMYRATKLENGWHAAKRILETLHPLGLVSNSTVLMVGCGLGFTCEALASDWPNERNPQFPHTVTGITVIGIDTSTYVQSIKGVPERPRIRQEMIDQGYDPDGGDAPLLDFIDDNNLPPARVEIHDYDLSTGKGRSDARKLIGNTTYDWGITDNVLPILSNNEATALTGWGEQCCDNIAHLLTPFLPELAGDDNWNWQTVAAWKALLPSTTIISLPTGEWA